MRKKRLDFCFVLFREVNPPHPFFPCLQIVGVGLDQGGKHKRPQEHER